MSRYLRNCWYVAAWESELGSSEPLARTIINEPLVLYRRTDGSVVALEDRCPHRHTALSVGRIEGDELRCMYHGLKFNAAGRCTEAPSCAQIPPRLSVRAFPVARRWSWIWVWMGDPARADESLIPDAFGLEDPRWIMRTGALDYAADYQLLNDNLLDLSHLDYVHERTLAAATGARWITIEPQIRELPQGLEISRWLRDNILSPVRPERVDTVNQYTFTLPGIFIMRTASYPKGAADESERGRPLPVPLVERAEQQAVTPIGDGRSRYLYASGIAAANTDKLAMEGMFAVMTAAFAEDKRMIEAQQSIWDATPSERRKAFLPGDRAPTMFRKLIDARIKAEESVV